MPRKARALKAADVERLENTSFASVLGGAPGGTPATFTACCLVMTHDCPGISRTVVCPTVDCNCTAVGCV